MKPTRKNLARRLLIVLAIAARHMVGSARDAGVVLVCMPGDQGMLTYAVVAAVATWARHHRAKKPVPPAE